MAKTGGIWPSQGKLHPGPQCGGRGWDTSATPHCLPGTSLGEAGKCGSTRTRAIVLIWDVCIPGRLNIVPPELIFNRSFGRDKDVNHGTLQIFSSRSHFDTTAISILFWKAEILIFFRIIPIIRGECYCYTLQYISRLLTLPVLFILNILLSKSLNTILAVFLPAPIFQNLSQIS